MVLCETKDFKEVLGRPVPGTDVRANHPVLGGCHAKDVVLAWHFEAEVIGKLDKLIESPELGVHLVHAGRISR